METNGLSVSGSEGLFGHPDHLTANDQRTEKTEPTLLQNSVRQKECDRKTERQCLGMRGEGLPDVGRTAHECRGAL